MKVVHAENAPVAVGPYVQAIQAGSYVFCSGQIPLDPKTGLIISENIEEQTDRVLQNLRAVCESAGGGLDRIVKTTVFLTDLSNFNKMNEIYSKYFSTHKPARSTIQVSALPRGSSVEIEAILFLGNS